MDDQIDQMILKYLLEQKMLGRDVVRESEIHEALGFSWDLSLDDRFIEITELGESAVKLDDQKLN